MKISVSLTHFEFKKQQTGKVKIMKKIITKTLDITPDMAAQMLERNTMNRNISQLNVTRYANDMASGAWNKTGKPSKSLRMERFLTDSIASGRSLNPESPSQ